MERRIEIAVVMSEANNEPVAFAVEELTKYMQAMTGLTANVQIYQEYDSRIPAIWVGEYPCFPHLSPLKQDSSPFDDEIALEVKGCHGIIAGLHPRSVLLAVYRYLTEAGCRWVRPGPDGELIPRKELELIQVDIREAPSYCHRGVCIEGAVSIDNVTAMIEWLPKVGMNSYFIQFREAYVFFDRWYRHSNNPLLEPETDFDLEKSEAFVREIVRELNKRGLIYHAVGHGWTCEPFGIRGVSWDYEWKDDITEEAISSMAMIGGERKLFGGIPLNTNLCYSNSAVRRKMVEEIVSYAGLHPEIDLLHVWLSDGSNNQCECETCALTTPSDCYVKLLNELDTALKEKAYSTKIVFLLYIDLLWPPLQETIKSPDRFMLLFAPYTRSYRQSYGGGEALNELPPYRRNRLELPESVGGNLAFLRKWQRLFDGDGIDFDYPFMWAHYRDPGLMNLSHIVSEDIKQLRQIGLNGYMSCQVQRAFFPHGLGMTVMARTLWNAQADARELANDYFRSAFGSDGPLVLAYMEEWSAIFIRFNLEQPEAAQPAILTEVHPLIQRFSEVIARNLADTSLSGCHILSWKYLQLHADIWGDVVFALQASYEGDPVDATARWEAAKIEIWRKEPDFQRVFDAFHFIRTLDTIMGKARTGGALAQ